MRSARRPTLPTARRPSRAPLRGALPALALLTLLAPAPAAQTWVALDGSPAGTPAEVTVLTAPSSDVRTAVEVIVHGFWSTDVLDPQGNSYQRLEVPGLQAWREPGEPELPFAPLRLAMGTNAAAVTHVTTQVQAQQSLPGYVVYPTPIPGEDETPDPTEDPGPGDPNGSDEIFTIDALLYGVGQDFPPTTALGGPVVPADGPVAAADVAMHPFSWHTTNDVLTITTHAVHYFDHFGSDLAQVPISKFANKSFANAFGNWSEVFGSFPSFSDNYKGRYLIIANVFWWDTLEPFVGLKKLQGYEVTVDTALADVTAVRDVINAWYDASATDTDHYVLLVGDVDQIPQAVHLNTALEIIETDDVYGDVPGTGAFRDVHVGRLSVDNEADLANQLAKIIQYQTNPPAGADYHRALLVANKEDAPGKYQGSMEKVATGSYADPPVFSTLYGATGGTNAQVNGFLDWGVTGDGVGLVAYRGHGSTRTWADWNLAEEWYHANDVMALANAVRPVVWSIACTNTNLAWTDTETPDPSADSISEVWMEVPNGAVAAYGATRTTSTKQNHLLNETLFSAVYNAGLTTHSHALEAAEDLIWALFPDHKNPWAYLLLGDPSMVIRRDEVEELKILDLPISLDLDDQDDEILVKAIAANGGEPPEGLASLWKESFLAGLPDETLGAWWLDGDEQWCDLQLLTPGTLFVTVRDVNGNQTTEEVPVTMGAAWTDVGNALAGAGPAPRLAGLGNLVANNPFSILGTGLPAAQPAYLALGYSVLNAPLKGGVLVPDLTPPAQLFSLPTDGFGNLVLPGTWPPGVPSGFEIVLQAWAADASGPAGFVATNGLIGRTP